MRSWNERAPYLTEENEVLTAFKARGIAQKRGVVAEIEREGDEKKTRFVLRSA